MRSGVEYAQMCRANPLDPEQGRVRICPIRFECQRYLWTVGVDSIHTHKMPPAPYDFDDEECALFLRKE